MIVVSGVNDNLISIDGDIEAEFNVNPDGDLLAFSNGVLLRVTLDDVWRINAEAGKALVGIERTDTDNPAGYTDVAHIIGGARWVACGDQWARSAA